jgi:hypothetical protein
MNYQTINQNVVSFFAQNPWLIALAVWAGVWKLIALWKAAKHDHLTMFIILAILNTAGIAEIIYIIYLYYSDKKKNSPAQMQK